MKRALWMAGLFGAMVVGSNGVVGAAQQTPAEVASPQTRDAKTILNEYMAMKMPTLDSGRTRDQAYVQSYMEERNKAMARRGELALELYRSDPKHPQATAMMQERWMSLLSSGKSADASTEAETFLKREDLDPKLKTEAMFVRAVAGVYSGASPQATMSSAEEFAKAAPADPRAGQLLMMAAGKLSEPGQQLKAYKTIVERFGGTPAAQGAEGKIKQVERVGKPFELAFTEAITGESVSMEKLRGKVVVIDFWAVWCGPCVAEMPKLKELYAEYKPKGVEFIGVSLDQPEAQGGLTKLKEFCRDQGIAWPQYYQGKGWESEFSRSWGINSIPAVFIVDAEGNLHSTNARGQLERLIPELLARRDARVSTK